jgi:hypothetical protein
MVTGLTAGLLGCAPQSALPLTEATRSAIADTIRAESTRMLDVMRSRQGEAVLAFYGRHTAYAGDGAVGDWEAIRAGTIPRYATYTRVDCHWGGALRIDVLTRTSAVVTGILDCQKADTTGKAWHEFGARTEVLAPEEGRWRIVAVHESSAAGSAGLK